jgi:hypothetical protein
VAADTGNRCSELCLQSYDGIILTPVIYIAEHRIEKYLGHDLAMRMKRSAMGQDQDAFMNIPTAVSLSYATAVGQQVSKSLVAVA